MAVQHQRVWAGRNALTKYRLVFRHLDSNKTRVTPNLPSNKQKELKDETRRRYKTTEPKCT